MTRLAFALLFAIATGCAAVPPSDAQQKADDAVPIREGEGESGCDAARARTLVGRERSEAVGVEALRLTGARALRWIRPGDAVTMDYRTDRLNIDLDAKGRITDLRCG